MNPISRTAQLDSIISAAKRIESLRPRDGRGVSRSARAWSQWDAHVDNATLRNVERELWYIVECLLEE